MAAVNLAMDSLLLVQSILLFKGRPDKSNYDNKIKHFTFGYCAGSIQCVCVTAVIATYSSILVEGTLCDSEGLVNKRVVLGFAVLLLIVALIFWIFRFAEIIACDS